MQNEHREGIQKPRRLTVERADDIGALPDKNAAEALARVPGVTLQRDQGEGRYISIRGLGPDLNSVSINGALVPAPEASRRGVALDVLPAGLISMLTVQKTLTPDQDANSLGGSVAVSTLSAFDLPGRIASATIGSSRDQRLGKNSPSASALFADRVADGRIGIAVGFSTERRDFASDNVETGGAWNAGRRSNIELRDYLPEREREALALNLDFRADADSSYYIRSFSSQFSDDEVRDRLTLSNIVGGSAEPGQIFTARGERRVRQRKYTQEISSVVFGTEQRFGQWQLDLAAGLSRADEDTPESLNDGRFRGTANFTGVSFNGTRIPLVSGPVGLTDPASYSLNSIVLQARQSEDSDNNLRFDLSREGSWGDVSSTLKFGAKWSRREKTNNTEQWSYNSSSLTSPNFFGVGPTSMSAFTRGPVDFALGTIGPGLDPALIRARVATLNRDAARLRTESTPNDYQMNEDIDAAYVQSNFAFARFNLLVGMRNERQRDLYQCERRDLAF